MTDVVQPQEEMWAVIELMGHGQTAGRLSKPAEFGDLWRVDVPDKDDPTVFYTEMYNSKAIYRVKFVSEEIARSYAPNPDPVNTYDAPIITREQHRAEVNSYNKQIYQLEQKNRELERRLTGVLALPDPDDGQEGEWDY